MIHPAFNWDWRYNALDPEYLQTPGASVIMATDPFSFDVASDHVLNAFIASVQRCPNINFAFWTQYGKRAKAYFEYRGRECKNLTALFRFKGPVDREVLTEVNAFLATKVPIRGFHFTATATTFDFQKYAVVTEYIPAIPQSPLSAAEERREVIDMIAVDRKALHWIINDTGYRDVATKTAALCIECGLPCWLAIDPNIRQTPAEWVQRKA